MKKIGINIILLVIITIFSHSIFAQKNIPAELLQRLAGKTKLTDIMREVEVYYDGGRRNIKINDGDGKEESNAYIQWKRWEWWMSSHLDDNGNFVRNINQLNYGALQEADRKWAGAIQQTLQDNRNNIARSSSEREQPRIGNFDDPSIAYGDWTFVGPTSEGLSPDGDLKGLGRLDRIAFHPTNPNIIYTGAPSGNLWKTTNGGTTWDCVTDGLPVPGIAGIAISPTNGNVIYILTGDGDSYNSNYLVFQYGSSRTSAGVFKSTDGGTTWSKMGNLFTGGDYEAHKLTISPTNGNYLFAATSQGIYRTTDGGTTWTQVRTGEHWDIEIKPNNDSVIYASTGAGIFYSTQGGRSGTWNTATTDFSVSGSGRIELAVSPDDANYVYALCGDVPSSGTFTGIFRSTNSGVSYTRRTNAPNILGGSSTGTGTGDLSFYGCTMTIKPSDALKVITGSTCVWRSSTSNGGSTMVFSTVYRESGGSATEYIHPDIHEVRYNPLNNYLYAATDGGFYRSIDDGVNWTNLSAGLATSQFYTMTMRDADANGEADGLQILLGAQDNGIKHRPVGGGSVFTHVICCDGYGVAISPDNSNILYYNFNDAFYKSTNGGSTNTFISSATFFSPVAIDYSNPDTVYLGGSSTTRSFDGFATSSNFAGNTSRVLVTCPSNTARLYGSAGNDVKRSDDRAATWTAKSGNPGWPAGTFTINDIEAYPSNSLEVYACFGGYSAGNKVMRTTNGGDNWTNWSGSLPNVPTYGLAVATEGVYVGTEIGVFFRGYGMTDWVPFYNQLPRTPVTELAVNENGLVYASTFGRGVWLSSRNSACAASLTISGNKTGPYYYEASNDVTATITTSGTTGDEIFVQAGNNVVLNPGFEIKAGSFFKAYIDNCATGIPVPLNFGNNQKIVLLPRINEINTEERKSVKNENYFSVTNGNIEFNVIEKGKLELLVKQKDGKWNLFYPAEVYPGHYSVPAPAIITNGEFRVLINGKNIPQLK